MIESSERAVRIKAELLSCGVVPTEAFLDAYGPPFLEKRRAYGNPDDAAYRERLVPQELFLLPERLVCAVNIRAKSPWTLDGRQGGFFVRSADDGRTRAVTFPLHPAFYDELTPDGQPAKNIITLYGGGSLGIFVYGSCALVDMGSACQYCSIAPNRTRETDFPRVVTEAALREALLLALRDQSCSIKQIMINGGNFPDPDRGFSYYARLVEVAREAIDRLNRGDVDLHLIVYPPDDLRLLDRLRGLDVGVAMNTEVFDPDLFRRFCPGKHLVSGQRHIIEALLRAVDALGACHVYSIFVGGLEDQDTMQAGMEFLAKGGVVPVINIFHADPDTPLHRRPPPSPERILEMGTSLQAIYERMPPFKPFYMDCGRNSIDTEAYLGLFRP
jgi:hypothetical protein